MPASLFFRVPSARLLPRHLPLLLLAGCAPAASDGSGRTGDRHLISAEEVEEFRVHSQGTAWDVVQEERPRWLRPQYVGTGQGVLPPVFVDGIRRGPISALREVPINAIERIRFMPGREASLRYGTGYPAGIILVYTNRR